MEDERIVRLEERVDQQGTLIADIDERQTRMHQDLGELTAALTANTKAQAEFNKFIENKRGFFGGIITTLSVLSGLLGAMLVFLWERITS